MAFSVAKSRPFRSLGLYKSSGKHAAPKGTAPSRAVPAPRPLDETGLAAAAEPSAVHLPAHAATSPRLTGPAGGEAEKTVPAEKTAA